MDPRLVDAKHFRELLTTDEAKTRDGSILLRKGIPTGVSATARSVDREARTIDFTISDESQDRDRDIIRVKGWDLKSFKANPVVLFAHDHREPAVARAPKIVKTDIPSLDSIGTQFPEKGTSPFADMMFELYAQKIQRATSVGFMRGEIKPIDEEQGFFGGVEFVKGHELWEFSLVPVGSNRNALSHARSLGIDTAPLKTWASRVLDEWASEYGDGALVVVGRSQLEGIQRAADPKQAKSFRVADAETMQKLRDDLERAEKNRRSVALQAEAKAEAQAAMTAGTGNSATRILPDGTAYEVTVDGDGEIISELLSSPEDLKEADPQDAQDPQEDEAAAEEPEPEAEPQDPQDAEIGEEGDGEGGEGSEPSGDAEGEGDPVEPAEACPGCGSTKRISEPVIIGGVGEAKVGGKPFLAEVCVGCGKAILREPPTQEEPEEPVTAEVREDSVVILVGSKEAFEISKGFILAALAKKPPEAGRVFVLDPSGGGMFDCPSISERSLIDLVTEATTAIAEECGPLEEDGDLDVESWDLSDYAPERSGEEETPTLPPPEEAEIDLDSIDPETFSTLVREAMREVKIELTGKLPE